MSGLRRPLIFTFVLLFVPVSQAADVWPVQRGPSREPVPVRFDRKMIGTVPKEFLEDSAACILYAGNSYLIEDDGTVEVITHDLTRLNGRKGVEKLGEYRNITFDPSYQKLTLNEACIHKPDGTTVTVQPRHVQLRDVGTDYQVYDHEKQLIISFPTLAVGDVIEVKWTVRGKNPEYAGNFFTRYSFGDANYPVVLDELRLQLPRATPFHYASVNDKVEPQIQPRERPRHVSLEEAELQTAAAGREPAVEGRAGRRRRLFDIPLLGRGRPLEAQTTGGIVGLHARRGHGGARRDEGPDRSDGEGPRPHLLAAA